MIDLDYRSMRETEVVTEPFRFLLVPNFVPPDALAAVLGDLPRLSRGGSFPIESVALGDAAAELVAALEGPVFRAIVAARFGLDLGSAPTMVTLRGQSREKDGRIHCDSTSKLVTVLLYLNQRADAWARQDGCLRLLRGADDIEDYAVEVPPVDGTLLVFANGPTCWHGHKRYVGARSVIQLNYMRGDREARAELRRHRFSAVVKRLIAA